MPVIEWTDAHDLDASRIIGQTIYGEFTVVQPHGGQIVATFTTRREGGGHFTARSALPTWADAVLWCEDMQRDFEAGRNELANAYRMDAGPEVDE